MSKKQKREQTDELLEKQFEDIQGILQLEVPAAAKARLIKMVTSGFDINSMNIVLRTEALLFKLLKYLGCKDAKEYLSLSTSDWGANGALHEFSEEMWNELIDGIDAPEFARWGELAGAKVDDGGKRTWDCFRRANKEMLFVGQVTSVEMNYFFPAYTGVFPIRVTNTDKVQDGTWCELLEIGKGDKYENDSGIVTINAVDVDVTEGVVTIGITYNVVDHDVMVTVDLADFLVAFTFVEASDEDRTRIPLYMEDCTFYQTPPEWTDRDGITQSYGGSSYFYIPPKLLFVDATYKYEVGDTVEVYHEYPHGEIAPGKIEAVNADGTYSIDFKDGNYEDGVKGSDIVYSDSKIYNLRKLATRWYVKCMYKHLIHDKGTWDMYAFGSWDMHANDIILRGITSKLRVKYIASLIQYEKPDPETEEEGFHVLIQEKEPDSWMNIFFNPKVIVEADMSGLFNLEKFKGKLAIFPHDDLKIELPYIETLGAEVFKDNTNLTSVRLENVLHIGDGAFKGCPIEKLHIPNVEHIGKRAFRDCKIQELRLENVSWIDDEAFEQVETLTTLDLPKLDMLTTRSFQHCPITYLRIPKVDVIYSWALTKIRVDKLYLPDVWKIHDNVFSEGSINFLPNTDVPNTDVYDIYMPKIRNIGRNFLSGMRRGVVPLPYEFLLENPDAYLKGIVGKPVQWVDKSRKEVVCIQLECIWDNGRLIVFVKILNRYDRNDMQTYPVGNRPTFKIIYTITDIMEKYFGQKIVIGNTLGPPRDVDVQYSIKKLEVTTERTKAINFREDMCKLIGKDGACKIDEQTLITKIMSSKKQVNSTLSAWTAVMVYKGSGGSSSWDNNNRVTGMMMSLKF